MFVGHYGVSLAARRRAPSLSLGALFVAVQLLDVLFAIFVLLGLEKLRIVHGFTAYNPYDLYWMPYTHSLAGALAWSVLGALAVLAFARRLAPRDRRTASAVFGAAVFSHFVLDVPMHTPDLPLWPGAGSPKIGLGLWNHPLAALAAEVAVLGAGLFLYLRATSPRSRGFAIGTAAFAVVLLAAALATPHMPDPPSGRAFAAQALVLYALLAAAAEFADRGRRPRDGWSPSLSRGWKREG
jgi:hypothetical protein